MSTRKPRWQWSRLPAVFLGLLLVCLTIAGPSGASLPVPWSAECCVIDGMLFSLPKTPSSGGYHIVPRGVDLGGFEGKRLAVTGSLQPGDRLDLKLPEGVRVLGTCDGAARAALRSVVAWAHFERAKERLAQEDLEGAERELASAMAMDETPCAFHLERGLVRSRKGLVAEAANDSATALAKGCMDRYPDLERAGKLLEKAGRRGEALDAYRKAAAMCEYAPDRTRIEEKARKLQKEMTTPR